MPIQQINPYVFFDGNAREAIAFYERVLGATVEDPMSYADVPGAPPAAVQADRLAHAQLRLGAAVFMVSDSMPGRPVPQESNVEICVQFDDSAEMERRFEALAAEGRITMDLHDAFWGDRFGALTDRFGVRWMFICAQPR